MYNTAIALICHLAVGNASCHKHVICVTRPRKVLRSEIWCVSPFPLLRHPLQAQIPFEVMPHRDTEHKISFACTAHAFEQVQPLMSGKLPA
jgi:hypothetical protein